MLPVGLLVWLHPSFLGFVWMQPPVRCISMVLVCLMHTFLHFVRCWYACLACFASPVWFSLLLCIFARLPTCSCISLCVIHSPIQWNYGHSIETYICPLRTPPFCLITCLFAFLTSFASLSFSMLVCWFVSLLVCWFVSFVFAFTRMERGHLGNGGLSHKG